MKPSWEVDGMEGQQRPLISELVAMSWPVISRGKSKALSGEKATEWVEKGMDLSQMKELSSWNKTWSFKCKASSGKLRVHGAYGSLEDLECWDFIRDNCMQNYHIIFKPVFLRNRWFYLIDHQAEQKQGLVDWKYMGTGQALCLKKHTSHPLSGNDHFMLSLECQGSECS